MDQNISPLENIFSFITISLSPVYNVMPKIDVYCLISEKDLDTPLHTAQALTVLVNISAIQCPAVFSIEHQYVSHRCSDAGWMRALIVDHSLLQLLLTGNG